MNEVYEIRIIKTNKLTDSQQTDVQKQLNNISGDFSYDGYSRVSYAIDKTKSTMDNPLLKIIKIEPIEGTILDEMDRLGKEIDYHVF